MRTKDKKWRLPSKINVAGIDYKVKRCSAKEIKRRSNCHKDDVYEVMGLCDYSSRIIYISSRLNPQEAKFTFAHELLHAVVDGVTQDDTYNDDQILHPLSRVFWGVLQEVNLVN
jgi:Zn-dependent peptidase ImmA (M78 family)